MASKDITELLKEWPNGDPSVIEELLQIVYAELRELARSFMRRERAGHTLQPTALVHEAYLRLVGRKDLLLQNRSHFFGLAAGEMRRILVDHARVRRAQKRGGGASKLSLEEAGEVQAVSQSLDVLALDEALESLAALDRQQARIIELRFFGGLSTDEIAGLLGVSDTTVERKWRMGRAYLLRKMDGLGEAGS